jgi:hypothetical protein
MVSVAGSTERLDHVSARDQCDGITAGAYLGVDVLVEAR